jgi:hypothetical protein
MTANTKSTIWTIALVGVFLFLVWKLWPALNAALQGGGGSSGGAVGGIGGYDEEEEPYLYYLPQQNPLRSLLSGIGNLFSGGGNSGSSGGVGSNALSSSYAASQAPLDFLNQFIDDSEYTPANGPNLYTDLSNAEIGSDQISDYAVQEFGPGNDAGWSQGYTPDDSGGGGDDSGD